MIQKIYRLFQSFTCFKVSRLRAIKQTLNNEIILINPTASLVLIYLCIHHQSSVSLKDKQLQYSLDYIMFKFS